MTRPLRTVLIYPPPWKLPVPGEASDFGSDGAPSGFSPGDMDGDFFQMPYGLLSIAAQLRKAGSPVKLLNLSAFPWRFVETILEATSADVFGMSCYTANRRGVKLVSELLRAQHPHAHITVGGPHATALPAELLRHYPDVDSVVVGEGEQTFLELLDHLDRREPVSAIPGLAVRVRGVPAKPTPRERIRDLDALASPHGYYPTHLFMTSRGCPGQCTFCAKNAVWGKQVRFHSVDYVLDSLEQALERLPVKMLQIKDDTFTASPKRARAICDGIVQRGLKFVWSCDTRVDVLDDELVRSMRLAGCERLSLGVESGSPKVLRAIKKRITPDQVLEATALAKKYGLQVRFFMMMGNRGESWNSFQQSLRLLDKAKPDQFLFSCLSVYPGTADYDTLTERGTIEPSWFFEDDFQDLKVPFDASDRDTKRMDAWFQRNKGIQRSYVATSGDMREVLSRLGEHGAAHLALAGALYEEGQLDEAEQHARRALTAGYPLPGLVHNYLACIAWKRGDEQAMKQQLREAYQRDPQHPAVVENIRAVRAWDETGSGDVGAGLSLRATHEFELLERTEQPALPGPLPDGFERW